MTLGTIPNKNLVRGLAQKYFQDELSSDATKYMSSYWMEHTQHSSIEFDDEGNLIIKEPEPQAQEPSEENVEAGDAPPPAVETASAEGGEVEAAE